VTTYEYGNHAIRTEDRRYIRYVNGDEELYDESADPYEWTNIAARLDWAAEKSKLAKFLPATNAPDISDESKGKTTRLQRQQARRNADEAE
jgi:hypothetical protein